MSLPPRPTARIGSIDELRGVTIFFVCLSHFSSAVAAEHPDVARWGMTAGMFASPTFLAISACLSSPDVEHARAVERSRYRTMLVDRGLFLLTIGHVLVCLSLWPHGGVPTLRRLEITDSIGLGLLLQASLPASSRLKLALGIGGLALYGAIRWSFPSTDSGETFLQKLLVGGNGISFPLLPWTSCFLVCSALGGSAMQRLARGTTEARRAAGQLASFAMLLLAAESIVLLAYLASRAHLRPDVHVWMHALVHPMQKFPPSYGYFALWLSVGALVAAIVLRAGDTRVWRERLAPIVAVAGRQTFCLFVVGFALYEFIRAHVPTHPLSLFACFITSLVLCWTAGWAVDRTIGHRWMTVGLRAPTRRAAVLEDHSVLGPPSA